MTRLFTAALLAVALALSACGGAPGIPHTISGPDDAACLTCHLDGVGESPKTVHPERPGCIGCHSPGGVLEVGAQPQWPGDAVLFAGLDR
jgi:hypothetical protein